MRGAGGGSVVTRADTNAAPAGPAGRRQGLEVAAHVAGGEPHRAEATDGQMGEVLADALAAAQDLVGRPRHRGGARQVLEVLEDPMRQAGPGRQPLLRRVLRLVAGALLAVVLAQAWL